MNLNELEKKFSDFAEEVEKKIEEFGRQIDERFSNLTASEKEKQPDPSVPSKRHSDKLFWGIALIIVGIILLGNHLRWFILEIPWIPAALIILGIYLVFENVQKR